MTTNPLTEPPVIHVSDETAAANNTCHNMSAKVENTVARSRECLRQNPWSVLIGAAAVGAALGCVIAMSRRPVPTLRARFADDPVQTTRDALYAALAPVAQHLHDGYDSARDGAGAVFNKLHRSTDSWGDQLCRLGSNLKFW